MESQIKPAQSGRLASLDILRGFDLFMLVFFQPVLLALGQQMDVPFMNKILYQFDHEVWVGFRFWDIIMPLFLFMCGASMPFSFTKYLKTHSKWQMYKKVLKRVVILYILGGVAQGNFLGLDPHNVQLYTNTLQAIAAGYLIAAILLMSFETKGRLIATVALLIIYWIPMTFCGDFTKEGNFAYKLEELILGNFRGDPTYTWIWSSLTFGATTMLGVFAGHIMRTGSADKFRTAKVLFVTGIVLTVAGWLWGLQMPVIKRIWTSSMVLVSGGYCFLLMALFYYLVDCKSYSKGLNWLKIYGMNSIVAYVLGELVSFSCIALSLCYGLEQFTGDYYPVVIKLANYSIVFFILWVMYKDKVFLKI